MNPELAPNAAQAQAEIAAQRKAYAALAQQKKQQAEEDAAAEAQKSQKERRQTSPLQPPRPAGIPKNVQAASRVAGVRRPPSAMPPRQKDKGVKIDT